MPWKPGLGVYDGLYYSQERIFETLGSLELKDSFYVGITRVVEEVKLVKPGLDGITVERS